MAVYNVLAGYELPAWLTVEITEEDGSKYVTFHSTIHVNGSASLIPSWGKSFTEAEILRDDYLVRKVGELYGLQLVTTTKWES